LQNNIKWSSSKLKELLGSGQKGVHQRLLFAPSTADPIAVAAAASAGVRKNIYLNRLYELMTSGQSEWILYRKTQISYSDENDGPLWVYEKNDQSWWRSFWEKSMSVFGNAKKQLTKSNEILYNSLALLAFTDDSAAEALGSRLELHADWLNAQANQDGSYALTLVNNNHKISILYHSSIIQDTYFASKAIYKYRQLHVYKSRDIGGSGGELGVWIFSADEKVNVTRALSPDSMAVIHVSD
jgi:hypothetical protein